MNLEGKFYGQQGTKIFQYCTCHAGRATYNFHSTCKNMHFSFKRFAKKNIIKRGYMTLKFLILLLRPTLKIFLFPLPDPVLPVWVGRSENYFF